VILENLRANVSKRFGGSLERESDQRRALLVDEQIEHDEHRRAVSHGEFLTRLSAGWMRQEQIVEG